jgi:hypothetical protein
MNEILGQRFARHRHERVGIAGETKKPAIDRYLPENYSIEETGWPPSLEAFLQWSIRHVGLLHLMQEVFIDQAMPKTTEEGVIRWHKAVAIVEAAIHAFNDFNELLEWTIENWQQKETHRYAGRVLGIEECDPSTCPHLQHPATALSHDIQGDPSPSSDL